MRLSSAGAALGLLRRDRLVQAALGVLALELAVQGLPALGDGRLADAFLTAADPLLLVLTLAALLWGRRRTVERRDRAFWDLLAAAWGCRLAVELVYFLALDPPLITPGLAADILYVLYYLFFAIAVGLKPHQRPARSIAVLRRRLEAVAGLTALFGLLIYFALVNLPEPLGLSLSFFAGDRVRSLLLMRVTLDLMLLGRLLYASMESERWRGPYSLLAAAMLVSATIDIASLLRLEGRISAAAGAPFALLVPLPGVLVLLAVRYLRLGGRPARPPAEAAEGRMTTSERGRNNPVALYALAVPAVHFLLYPLGLLDEASRSAREVFSLCYVLVVGAVVAFHQMLVEKDRRQVLASLEREVEERKKVNRELELRHAEMEQFTYTISHELKTPLVTILGFVGLLEQSLDSEARSRAGQDLQRIRVAATQMRELLQELLDLSRVGWILGPSAPVPMARVVEAALAKLEMKLRPRPPRIQVADDLPLVEGDEERLVDVMTNLIDNAVKFAHPERPVEIRIGRREGPLPTIYVADNGRGIEPRFRERVFGLFDRLYPEIEGTGVGLALVKRIVEAHGGRVWVESAGEGHGSTFYVSLPAAGD